MNFEPWTPAARSRRRGVSILEVMFAILVATVGLLGAVAVFPVASSMARKGRINDTAAAAGRSAIHDFDARMMRRPDRWIGYSQNWDFPTTGGPQPPGYRAIIPVPIKMPDGTTQQTLGIRWPLGTAFCIDPRVISRATTAQAADVSLFPAVQRTPIPNVPMAHPNTVDPRMFRISLASGLRDAQGNLIYNPTMGQLQTDSIFTFDDDLSYDRPDEDRSKPAEQIFDLLSGTGSNAKRLSEGHFSWMATLVPKVEMVETIPIPPGNQILFGPKPTDEYVLSIVVYHDRDMVEGERLVNGLFEGDGATGGEILLTDNSPDQLKLKSNDWVMVAGTYVYWEYKPDRTPVAEHLSNVSHFQWYRVSDCDDVEQVTGNPAKRYATLVGQDWHTQALVNPRFGVVAKAAVQVTIVQNVVAVYEKTVRLEY